MPLFGPPAHPTQKAPPEVNRFWRRLMWDNELTRLYSHLEGVTHSIDSHQKKLYMENTFHDQARDRATQLYADRISRENIGLFKRLMAVHTRKPKEFRTHQVQNPKTHSRFLEYQRVMEDNHRLVDRLLQSRTFVNERGSWDEFAQEHEEILLRLSHAPKNVFVPDLHTRRKQEQKRFKHLSIAEQARQRIKQRVLPLHEQQAAQLRNVEQQVKEKGIELSKTWSGEALYSPKEKKTLYSYPLPPSSLPNDPSNPYSHTSTDPSHPPVLIPHGTHLVAPALVDQEQYESIAQRLAQNEQQQQQQQHSDPSSSSSPSTRRQYAMTGDLSDALFTFPMPPPSPRKHGAGGGAEHQMQQQQPEMFYLQPNAHRARSMSPTQTRHERTPSSSAAAAAASPSAAAPNAATAAAAAAQEAEPIPYPFPFPALEGGEGSAVDFARREWEETQRAQEMHDREQQLQQQQRGGLAHEYPPPRAHHSAEGGSHSGRGAAAARGHENERANSSYAASRPFTHASEQQQFHQQQEQQIYAPHPPSSLYSQQPPHSARAGPQGLSSAPSQKFLDYFHGAGNSSARPPVPRGRTDRGTKRLVLPAVKGSAAAAAAAQQGNEHAQPPTAHYSSHSPHPPSHHHSARSSGSQQSIYAHSTSAGQGSSRENRRRTQTEAMEAMLDLLLQDGAEKEAATTTASSKRESKRNSTTQPHPPSTARMTSKPREEEKQADGEQLSLSS